MVTKACFNTNKKFKIANLIKKVYYYWIEANTNQNSRKRIFVGVVVNSIRTFGDFDGNTHGSMDYVVMVSNNWMQYGFDVDYCGWIWIDYRMDTARNIIQNTPWRR